MKRIITLLLSVLPLLSMAQDDFYFTPTKKAKTVNRTVKMNATVTPVEKPTLSDYNSCTRSEDDYNRRYTYSGDSQNAGGLFADTARLDTVYLSDYDMEDPELDYRYSRRLVRFHSPRYYSPYYWDVVYGYGAWDYLYDPYYDPWYYHYGWGYGWSWGPWDCWYGGIWGWHHPYHWSYWGWGPSWYHGYYVGGGYSHGYVNTSMPNYRPRGTYATTNGRFGGTRTRTSPQDFSRRDNSASSRTSGISTARTSPRGLSSRTNRTDMGNRGTYTDYARSRSEQQRVGGDRGTATRTSANRYGARTTDNSGSYDRARSSSRTSTSSRSYSNSTSSSRSSSYSNSSSSSYTPSRSTSSSSGSFSSGSSARSSSGGGFSGGGSSRGGGGRR